jgi:hypothetical protein
MTHPTIFVSYSHRDAASKERLVAALERRSYPGQIDVWEDGRLRGGDVWRNEIERAIAMAKVAVLLVSEDFLASEFIRDEEVPRIFQARIGGGTKIVPVSVADVCGMPEWLSALQRIPAGGQTLVANPETVEQVADEVVWLTQMSVVPYLPFPGTIVPRSFPFVPVSLIGLRVNRDNPFLVQFLVDPGDAGPDAPSLRAEAERLIRYFLVGLSVPESHIWVNLSPYERDRVISPDLARSELGRDLLAQDYLLKQFNASSVHPATPSGRRYWAAVHGTAANDGDEEVTRSSGFEKVWIVPERAEVFEDDDVVVVASSRLGVRVKADRLAAQVAWRQSWGDVDAAVPAELAPDRWTRTFEAVLQPALEAEINEGRHFAITRQAFGALVLARWFKVKINNSLLQEVASPDCSPGPCIESDFIAAVFGQYVSGFERGVMNCIHEDVDPVTGDLIPRKYFAGGFTLEALRDVLSVNAPGSPHGRAVPANRRALWLETEFVAVNPMDDAARGTRTSADPGGIDLDLSRPGRIRAVKVGTGPEFGFSAEALAALGRRRGRAIVPVVRDMRPCRIE